MIKGSKHSNKTKLQISVAQKGKQFSGEHRRKLSLALMGNQRTLGYKLSKEHKRKISEACKELTGPKNSQWKGGIRRSDDRVYIKKPEHPYAKKSGYVRRSRLVMEQIIGRHLKPKEVVHHINSIRNDDREENLQLFLNQAAHMQFHHHKKCS